MPIATVNGKKYKTVFDEGGVERFSKNRVVAMVFQSAQAGRKFRMDDIARWHENDAFSRAEVQQFYRLIGYTVAGFSSIFDTDRVTARFVKKNKKARSV